MPNTTRNNRNNRAKRVAMMRGAPQNNAMFLNNPMTVTRETLKKSNRPGALGWQYGSRQLLPEKHIRWNATMNNRGNKNTRGAVKNRSFMNKLANNQQAPGLRESRQSVTYMSPLTYGYNPKMTPNNSKLLANIVALQLDREGTLKAINNLNVPEDVKDKIYAKWRFSGMANNNE